MRSIVRTGGGGIMLVFLRKASSRGTLVTQRAPASLRQDTCRQHPPSRARPRLTALPAHVVASKP